MSHEPYTAASGKFESPEAAAPLPLSRFGAGVLGLAQYRTLAYMATFFSGAVSLTFQVVWQRYLSFMVGSEARSIALVVAVFLLGLAAGYRFWGNFTARGWTRRTMLKAVGFIELTIALYGVLFIFLFPVVREMVYRLPDLLLVDFAATAALVFIPTFLMGASIPLLTAAIPSTMKEVNYCHTRIYGINTLGAFVGTFFAGFILVPYLGLSLSLIIGAVVNMFVGLAFFFNTLEGDVQKGEESVSIPNKFGASGIYMFVFITGAVTIGFEVLFMRLLALSIGSGHYVFPIVVGIVILGLAIGSLSIRRGSVTADRVIYELIKLGVLLVVVYWTVQYWPLWLSHWRVSLTSIPSNYSVYMAGVVAFMMIILLPVVIPMGRLLPMGYSLIDKNSSDYGKMCGRVYFSNTIGTVVGAVGIGYMLLVYMEVDRIFVLNIALIFLLAAYLVFRQHAPTPALACAMGAALVPLLLVVLPWDRQLHVHGLFRVASVQQWHFKGVRAMPNLVTLKKSPMQGGVFRRAPDGSEFQPEASVLFLKDDPSVTVAVNHIPAQAHRGESRTIFVNGKSDGNTIADYSNMALSAMLPYLYASPEGDLEVAVIGLGMGITSGALSLQPDVKQCTTIEISTGVIEAVRFFEDSNFGLRANEKHRMVQTDAFRFFTRSPNKFDVIVSEPSNPWVVGVENLYTPEFYTMAVSRLNPGGVFFQWLQVYEIENDVLAAIVANVAMHFEHVTLYILGPYDLGILASNEPMTRPHLSRRMQQSEVRRVMQPMSLEDEDLLVALEIMRTDQVRALALNNARLRFGDRSGREGGVSAADATVTVSFRTHRMDWPWLGHAAGRARFLGQAVEPDSALLGGVSRHLIDDPQRREQFDRMINTHGANLQQFCRPQRQRHSTHFVCTLLESLAHHHAQLRQPLSPQQVPFTLSAYHHLREYGYISQNISLLDSVRGLIRESPERFSFEDRRMAIGSLSSEYGLERQWDVARGMLEEFYTLGILTEQDFNTLMTRMEGLHRRFAMRMAAVGDWKFLIGDDPASEGGVGRFRLGDR